MNNYWQHIESSLMIFDQKKCNLREENAFAICKHCPKCNLYIIAFCGWE